MTYLIKGSLLLYEETSLNIYDPMLLVVPFALVGDLLPNEYFKNSKVFFASNYCF